MANITTLKEGSASYTPTMYDSTKVYVVENVINFADALTAKGSALASSDTIEALQIPAGTFILFAGIQTILADDATTLTLDLGMTGGTVDHWVDGYDQAAAAAGDYAAWDANAGIAAQFVSAADTLDVLFATLTGTLTIGKIRVFAVLADCSGTSVGGYSSRNPGIAAVGS